MRYVVACWFAVLSCAHISKAKAQDTTPAPKRVMISVGDIDTSAVDATIEALATLEADPEVTEVWLRIDSHGGEIDAGMRLIQAFDQYKKPLVCVVDTKAYSMGAVILQACPMRLATSRSSLMFHEALVQQAAGNEHDLSMTAAALHVITESLVQVCAGRMGLTAKQLHQKINNTQWWLTADDALAAHAVDALVSPTELPPLLPVAARRLSVLELLGGGR